LLYARVGRTFSPVSGKQVKKDTPESIIDELKQKAGKKTLRLYVYCEFNFKKHETLKSDLKLKIDELKKKVLTG